MVNPSDKFVKRINILKIKSSVLLDDLKFDDHFNKLLKKLK